MKQLPTFFNDRLALVGDAAHPFAPYLAQGEAQAIEDAVSLGVVLGASITTAEVPERLQLYNKARYTRASIIQDYGRLVEKEEPSSGKSESELGGKSSMSPFI